MKLVNIMNKYNANILENKNNYKSRNNLRVLEDFETNSKKFYQKFSSLFYDTFLVLLRESLLGHVPPPHILIHQVYSNFQSYCLYHVIIIIIYILLLVGIPLIIIIWTVCYGPKNFVNFQQKLFHHNHISTTNFVLLIMIVIILNSSSRDIVAAQESSTSQQLLNSFSQSSNLTFFHIPTTHGFLYPPPPPPSPPNKKKLAKRSLLKESDDTETVSFTPWKNMKRARHKRLKMLHLLKDILSKNIYVITNTTLGPIRGRRIRLSGSSIHGEALVVDTYLGIPFAEPPIKELRFKAPVPKQSWLPDIHYIYNATESPKSCVQSLDNVFGNFEGSVMWNANTELSEDCLYLNLWVPYRKRDTKIKKKRNVPDEKKDSFLLKTAASPHHPYFQKLGSDRTFGSSESSRKAKKLLLPIIVWVYGGGYYSGTITLPLYDGSVLASKTRVIVASMNYRLGSLGFLYFGNKEAPGNQGLLDQLLAIKWVKENALHFGGDPDRITLMGESAGASSVAFHLLSPLSADYINSAILQSASATSPWALVSPQEAIKRGLLLADSLKCPHTSIDKVFQILQCLREAKAEIILDREFVTSNAMQFPFVPVIDGYFVVANPAKLLEIGLFKRIPLILGSNLNEGTSFSIYFLERLLQPLREDMSHLKSEDISSAVKDIYWHLPPVAQEAVYFYYNDWGEQQSQQQQDLNISSAAQVVRAIDQMAGDLWFTCNVNEFASYYAYEGVEVYMYQFGHRSSRNPWPQWMGVMHGDEIPFVFGEPFKEENLYLPEERELSTTIMTYWANFAYNGDPNICHHHHSKKSSSKACSISSGITDIRWPIYTAFEKNYLRLKTNMSTDASKDLVQRGPRMRSCAFQKLYLPQLNRHLENFQSTNNSTCSSTNYKNKHRKNEAQKDAHRMGITSILTIVIITTGVWTSCFH